MPYNRFLLIALLGMLQIALAAHAAPMIPHSGLPLPASATVDNQSSWYEQGLAALDRKKHDEARTLFLKAIKQDTTSPLPLLGLAEVARRDNQSLKAEQWIRKAAQVAPLHPDSLSAVGRLHYAKGEYGQAEQFLLQASAAAPQRITPLLDLGELYLHTMARPAQAVRVFQKAVALEPKHAGARFALGSAHLALADFPEAVHNMEDAVHLAPENPMAHIGLSDAHNARGNADRALASLDRAVKLLPQAAELHVKLGMLHQQNARWSEAIKAYEAAIALDKKNALAFNNLAWIAAEQKVHLGAAADWANRAIALVPNEPGFKDTLAWVKRAKGDHQGALDLLESLAGKPNVTAEVMYHLGVVRAEVNHGEAAAWAFRRALKLNPDFGHAADARQRLKQLGKH